MPRLTPSTALALAASLAAACQTIEADKPTISDAPFSGDYADGGKDDSWRRPWNAGVMRVGETRRGTFDTAHGWLAYEIDFLPGEVDISLSDDVGSALGLDTLLMVYGPKTAAGNYPRRALAVNDDVESGQNLSSHLRLDVPTAGTYRVVASTYDNWVEWPSNVSAADYKTTIKCPRTADGGLDACGPHVRWPGDGCFDDAACGAGATCEGEITCSPGTECLWVREGVCVVDDGWVSFAARQCGQNPWQASAPTGDGQDAGLADAELEQVDRWLEDLGIDARSIGRLDHEGDAVCLSCACSRGDSILIRASHADAARLVAEQGFGWALSDHRSQAPVQCGGNPWEVGDPAQGELAQVRTWAAAQGAPVSQAGFVFDTEPTAVCLACSCPRGDHLVVTPAAGTDRGMLGALGFGSLYQ